MKYSPNTPLTREEVKELPRRKEKLTRKRGDLFYETEVIHDGFTPTSVGITGQELKRMGRGSNKLANRKPTKGMPVQIQRAPVFQRDENGKLPKDDDGNEIRIQVGTKIIRHTNHGRLMNQ